MKKILVFFVFMFMFIGVQKASAASMTTVCGDPADSTPTTTYVVCGSNGSPEIVVNVWGTTNSQIPHVLQGQSVVMSNGITATCPIWFSMYCVDISHTDYFMSRWGHI